MNVRMREQWGPEELAEEEPWNSQAFRSMSRRQQNLEIYKVRFSKHVPKTTEPRDLQGKLLEACPEDNRIDFSDVSV